MAFLKGLSSKPWWDEDIPKWIEVEISEIENEGLDTVFLT